MGGRARRRLSDDAHVESDAGAESWPGAASGLCVRAGALAVFPHRSAELRHVARGGRRGWFHAARTWADSRKSWGGRMSPYADADHYDRMVTDHVAPDVFDDGEDLLKTPETARQELFNNVAATYPPRRPAGLTYRPAHSPASHVDPVAGPSS